MEAGCLEWALLVAILLRDTISVVRVVNTASLTDTPIEIVGRMREGLSFLELWADTQRYWYRWMMFNLPFQVHSNTKLEIDYKYDVCIDCKNGCLHGALKLYAELSLIVLIYSQWFIIINNAEIIKC